MLALSEQPQCAVDGQAVTPILFAESVLITDCRITGCRIPGCRRRRRRGRPQLPRR
jgi:hypothetical protein